MGGPKPSSMILVGLGAIAMGKSCRYRSLDLPDLGENKFTWSIIEKARAMDKLERFDARECRQPKRQRSTIHQSHNITHGSDSSVSTVLAFRGSPGFRVIVLGNLYVCAVYGCFI